MAYIHFVSVYARWEILWPDASLPKAPLGDEERELQLGPDSDHVVLGLHPVPGP